MNCIAEFNLADRLYADDQKRNTPDAGRVHTEEKISVLQAEPVPTVERISALQAENANQDGDAFLFQQLQRGKFVFDHAMQTWFCYSGHSWRPDLSDEATGAMQSIIDAYGEEATIQSARKIEAAKEGKGEISNKHAGQEKRLLRRMLHLQEKRRKDDVLYLAARIGKSPLKVVGDEWDSDPYSIGCKNGIIDLRTGEHRAGKPTDYIKTATPTNWLGLDAPCPRWEEFLSEIFSGNQQLKDYVQRLLGYGITGLTTIHISPILWGTGRNGKGALLETLKHVLGPLAYKTESELLLDQKFSRQSGSPNTGVLQLRGKRLVWASETNEGRRLNAGKLKELVGGDTLNARPMYGKRHIEFRPTHLLLLLTNSKPKAPANDYALWQRLALIPFLLSFVDDPVKENERKADPDLMEKLKTEAPGILAWLVRGCLKWQQEGLTRPEVVKAATAEYRDSEDLLKNFITDCCVEDRSREVRSGILYKRYKDWCDDQGHHALNGTNFGKEMKERYDWYEKRHVFYIGLGVDHD